MKEELDKLRKLLGFPTDPAMAAYIGISTRSLYYAWRDAQYSAKTAAKIEAACERASNPRTGTTLQYAVTTATPRPGLLRESASSHGVDKSKLRAQIAVLEQALRIAKDLLEEKP